jgi:membrane protease subunit HflK
LSNFNEEIKKILGTNEDIQLPKGIGKVLINAILIAVVVVLMFNSYYSLEVNQQAVISTFGKPSAVTDSGPHFKIPFVQSKTILSKEITGIKIGYEEINGITKSTNEAQMITSDMNIINVDFYLEFLISDPVQYMYASEYPVEILKNLTQGYIRGVVSNYTVDQVITTSKQQIQADIKEKLIEELSERNIGIQIVNITIQDSEPPTENVINAFKNVETAKQNADTAINNAKKYANEVIPQAEAEADEIVKNAEAEKQSRINEANGQVARFNELYLEYVKFPEITKTRMYYETMQQVIPNVQIIIDSSDNGTNTLIPANINNNNNNLTTEIGGIVNE